MLPSVGLICGLKNSSIQMQNTPQNNYALSIFFQFTLHITPPFVLFFPLHAHCSFTFAFWDYFATFKYECILHSHTYPCGKPAAIEAYTFHHTIISPFGKWHQPWACNFTFCVSIWHMPLWLCSPTQQIYLPPREKSRAGCAQLLKESSKSPLLWQFDNHLGPFPTII